MRTDPADSASADPARPQYSLLGTARESLLGPAYSHPERWRPLSLGTFFSEGWDQPWIAPPPGGGGAPRQSWLNAFVRRHLRGVVREYTEHYHVERNHQGLGNRLIDRSSREPRQLGRIGRRARLGGLLNFYYREAA